MCLAVTGYSFPGLLRLEIKNLPVPLMDWVFQVQISRPSKVEKGFWMWAVGFELSTGLYNLGQAVGKTCDLQISTWMLLISLDGNLDFMANKI